MDQIEILESKEACEASLSEFIRQGWKYIDPNAYHHSWHVDAVCEHLEAVANGDIRRLIINIPPRTSKSSIVSVGFSAWIWAQSMAGPISGPQTQILSASYANSLSIRDSVKTRRLITSPWFQARWPHVALTSDQAQKQRFDTTAGGYRIATSVGGALTGEGANLIILDDPNNAMEAESEVIRTGVNDWWDSAMSTRLNDPKTGAYVVVQQRFHSDDLTGHLLDRGDDWVHLMLPMRFEADRKCYTVLGWEDPRTYEGELLCPERFGDEEVSTLERALGPYGASGQLQQRPTPAGGSILRREWWQLYDEECAAEYGAVFPNYPAMSYIVGSLDTAFGEKEENDYSALSIWGVFQDDNENPNAMLMDAWKKRLPLHGSDIERKDSESEREWKLRTSDRWGLIQWVAYSCKRYKVDLLLVENKASGISVGQEMKRLHRFDGFGVRLVDPGRIDKVARAHAVAPSFAEGQIYAPDRKWSEEVITECELFPKAPHDDQVDTVTQAIKYLRDAGLLQRKTEVRAAFVEAAMHTSSPKALYET
jgi:predicted phage terminase large subunit-like protein